MKEVQDNFKQIINELFDAYGHEIPEVTTTSAPKPPPTFSFSQKAHISAMLLEFKEAFKEWVDIIQDSPSPGKIDTIENTVEGVSILKRDDYTIYKDKWTDFLNTVQNGIVGTGQQKYKTGANPYAILRGAAPGTYGKKGEISFAKTPAINPEILKNFHERIMIPLFMKNPDVLLYATPEQWASISKGGIPYKGITGLGKQIFSAGQNAPKVTL